MNSYTKASTYLLLLVSYCWVTAHAQKPELVVQTGHSYQVHSAAFSSDGKIIASGAADYTVKLWDAETGRELRTMTGHSGTVHALTFSDDSQLLASESRDETIKIWNVLSGRLVRTIFASGPVAFVKGSDIVITGGSTIQAASGKSYGTIKFWKTSGGEAIRSQSFEDQSPSALSRDGRLLATSGANGSSGRQIKIWDVGTGRELQAIAANVESLWSMAFSRNNRIFATGDGDDTATLWDVETGKKLFTIKGHSHLRNPRPYSWGIKAIDFGDDDKIMVTGGGAPGRGEIMLWDVATGKHLRTLSGHRDIVYPVHFSPNSKTLVSVGGREGADDRTIIVWDVASGKPIRTLQGHSPVILSIAFSADGKTLARGGRDNAVRMWDVKAGTQQRTLGMTPEAGGQPGNSSGVNALAFTHNGRLLATGTDIKRKDQTIIIWDVATGSPVHFLAHSLNIHALAFSTDDKLLASAANGTDKDSVKLWNVRTGKELRSLAGNTNDVNTLAFSPDGKVLAAGSGRFFNDTRSIGSITKDSANLVRLWEVSTGRELRSLRGHLGSVTSVSFSLDGKVLISGSADETVKLWDVTTGKELRTLRGSKLIPANVDFRITRIAPGTIAEQSGLQVGDVITGIDDQVFKDEDALRRHISSRKQYIFHVLRDDATKDITINKTSDLMGFAWRPTGKNYQSILSVAFSPDGKIIASGASDGSINFWKSETGEELRRVAGHSGPVNVVVFAESQILLSGGEDAQMKLWDVGTGKEMASVIALDESDWLIATPSGLFDASVDAQKLMFWRIGKDLYDVIALEQLKERYYEPGLLAKIFGFNKEPIRDVSKFENPKLYPLVKYEPPAKGSSMLVVSLLNRGGGIGRVQVFVNGKEFLADARDDNLRQNPEITQATLNIDLSKASSAVAGRENQLRVVAWNVENYISSRGDERVWVAGGPTNEAPPEVYALIGGISQYAGPKLNLNFAAKDAVDVANAIELGAKRLFGANKVHLTLLTTAKDRRAIAPTKDNFSKAFVAARQAKPTDILIVYLAGHGITLQRGSDMYCYLTQQARTTDTTVLSDPEVRKEQTITSEELVDWIKKIPALKQVVILDTCAAGAAQEQLKLIDKREPSGDAIRAIDRAKDRTGSHILMGSAADAASYEASQYGQGLLTYALLKGMKGPGLSNDEFVDVSKLFRFAREEVEQLAKNVGGIQKPIIFAPNDESFEVGQLNLDDKQKITLSSPKPMILRPRFLDSQADDDTLDLMKSLRMLLRDESFVIGRGASEGGLVFVDDDDFPSGIRPTGRYTVEGNKVTIRLRLRRDGIDVLNTQVISTKQDVAAKVLEVVKEAVRKL